MTAASAPTVAYYKRYRMELELGGPLPPVPPLPAGLAWVAWDDAHLEAHAAHKYECFRDEVDGVVFPQPRLPRRLPALVHETSAAAPASAPRRPGSSPAEAITSAPSRASPTAAAAPSRIWRRPDLPRPRPRHGPAGPGAPRLPPRRAWAGACLK